MALNSYGLECLQGMLFGFASIGIVLVLLVGITRLLKDSLEVDDG